MGIKLSVEGKKYMDIQRQKKGYKRYDEHWCHLAHVSQSTLKRFWQGEISPDNFRAICEAIDVDLAQKWDLLVEGDKKDSTRVEDLKQLKDIYTLTSKASITHFKITVRGVGSFEQNHTQLLRESLDDLQYYLDEKYIEFPASPIQLDLKNKFTIHVNGIGLLDENEQLIVQGILREIEHFLISPQIKMTPIQA